MSYSKPGASVYPDEIKLYKRRWLLMGVFLCHVVNLSLHWVEFSSISNTVTRYYGVSPIWVEWTTIVFMVAYLVGVFPALYILDKFVSNEFGALSMPRAAYTSSNFPILGNKEEPHIGDVRHSPGGHHQTILSISG